MSTPRSFRLSSRLLAAGLIILLVGLAARTALLLQAPRHAFLADHLDSVVWSEWAYRYGPLAMYDLPPFMPINVQLPNYLGPPHTITPLPSHNACNYPPLAGYIYWTQGALWHLTNPPAVSRPVHADVADLLGVQPGAALQSPVANTLRTRCAAAFLPTIADLLLAVGAAYLVYATREAGSRYADNTTSILPAATLPKEITPAPAAAAKLPVGRPELITFALVWLAPPIMLTSAFWGQIDSLVTAPMIWCLALLVRGRPTGAGLTLGLALLVKPQGILIIPAVWLALLASAAYAGRLSRRATDAGKLLAGTLLVLIIFAGPQTLADLTQPNHDPWRWFIRAYPETMTQKFPVTTMKAFNIWWLDFVATGQQPATLLPDRPTIVGLTKETLGRSLALIAIGLAATACIWRYHRQPAGWTAFAGLAMLAVFLFPTRIHERYIFYCLPFITAAALLFRPWLPVWAALLVVASAEITWNLWLAPATQGPDAPAESSAAVNASAFFAFLALAGFVYAVLTLLLWPRPAPTDLSATAQPPPNAPPA